MGPEVRVVVVLNLRQTRSRFLSRLRSILELRLRTVSIHDLSVLEARSWIRRQEGQANSECIAKLAEDHETWTGRCETCRTQHLLDGRKYS